MCDIFTLGDCVTHCKAGRLEECHLYYSWRYLLWDAMSCSLLQVYVHCTVSWLFPLPWS